MDGVGASSHAYIVSKIGVNYERSLDRPGRHDGLLDGLFVSVRHDQTAEGVLVAGVLVVGRLRAGVALRRHHARAVR